MPLSRSPKDVLRPFVRQLWASEGDGPPGEGSNREMMLPSGALHLVLRLAETPLRIFRHRDDRVGFTVSAAVIGGPRSGPYLKDVSRPVPSVGALLAPGAAGLLIGAPAGAFAGRHTALEDVWGAAAVTELREKLWTAGTAARRLDLFEAALAARLPRLRGIDPLIAQALAGFDASLPVAAVVGQSGYSHRHFSKRFTETVGLKPKTYGRLLRFGRVLARLSAGSGPALADLAADEGYADQAHLNREFREFAGLSPGRYRRLAPRFARHVRL
ncbi:helix-turn-helix transcriptional regulator [Pelagibius litoralis]|uniref:Helix-turn-helix transcriptional regulator n=1 Tax=Pelagibius litoralis TaxID=374515 RepID=A0A967F156_9PROT|nr:AraC family transcriptional regulator [Pelagibius litoralis]NIA71123.1 helix-turn-helix transcriptional regulator [Pelagibius litoralis]